MGFFLALTALRMGSIQLCTAPGLLHTWPDFQPAVPQRWEQALDRLLALAPLPDPGFGSLLWQAVLGAWGSDPDDVLRERLHYRTLYTRGHYFGLLSGASSVPVREVLARYAT